MGALLGLVAGIGSVLVWSSITSAPRPRRSRTIGPLTRLVEQAAIPRVTNGSVIGACIASGLVVGTLVLIATAVPMAALLAAVLAGALPVLLLRRRVHVRIRALRVCWPDAVDQLVSAVRAGMALPEALADLARRGPEPLRPAFGVFASEYRATGSFFTALEALQEHLADPVADRVIASLRIAREVGGTDLGTVLRTLSALLREDARTRGDIEARQSWTVAAARISVAAPWLTLAFLSTRPEGAAAYRTITGAIVMLAAAGASVIAYRMMIMIGRLPTEPRMIT
jgi:tight adherence protein B